MKSNNVKSKPASRSATTARATSNGPRPRQLFVVPQEPKTLKEKMQTHGKIESGPSIFDYMKGKEFPYNVKDIGEYKESLAKMTTTQLHEGMMKVNLIPNITDRFEIISRLEKVFLEKHATFLLRYSKSALPSTEEISPDRAKNILEILNNRR